MTVVALVSFIATAASVDVASASPATWTGIVLAGAAMLTAIAPFIFRALGGREAREASKLASWQALTSELQQERDRLQKRVDEADALCQVRVDAIERQRVAQADTDRQEIESCQHVIEAKTNEITQLRHVIRELRYGDGEAAARR